VRDIVLAGLGVSAALPFQLARDVADGLCVFLPIELPWLKLNYGFIFKRGRTLSPAARVFLDLVRQIEQQQASESVPPTAQGSDRGKRPNGKRIGW
jgi:DNA-binding transcriptional LysR family regulator